MAYVPNSGSVAAWIQSNNSSVITVGSGSVFAVVQGLQGASVSGTVTANQGTNPWIITGSVQASLAPAANQSVSGTVGASVIGLTPVAVTNIPSISGTVNIGNTVTINPPSIYGNISGSVVAFINNTPAVSVQGTVFVSGSVITVGGSGPANQSVSGTVGASIIGNVSTTITSVATVGGFLNVNLVGGSILTSSTPNQSVSGTVNVLTGNSSVITVSQGSIATVIVGGSIATSFTPPANQSVSGAVSVSNFPTTQNVSGSVVATQGTNPWTVVSSISGGIFPISGSVAATITNTNVNVSGSVAAFLAGSTNASVITVGTAVANQSVSGTVGSSIIGTVPVTFASSVYGNISGSVVAFQGTTPWTISSVYGNVSGSIAGTYTSSTVATTVTGLAMMFKPNVSSSIMTEISPIWPLPITGAVAASISGTVATTLSGNPSISGTVLVNNGSVVAFQGGAPWTQTFSNSSIIAIQSGSVVSITQGSVATVIIGGSIAASFTPPANQSVSGTVQTDVRGSVATVIIGGSIAASFTPPANQSVSGVVMAQGLNAPNSSVTGNPVVIGGLDQNGSVQGAKIVTVVSVAGGLAWLGITSVSGVAGASIIGTVPVTQSGTFIASIASSTPSSVLVGASIFGQLPSGTAMLGSVVAYQGATPWIETFSNSSIIAINAGSVVAISQGSVISVTQGSVATVQMGQIGTQMTSVTGTTAANSASIISGLGFVTLGVRNDGMASVLSTTNGFYGPFATGSWGDQIVSVAPSSVWTSGIGSVYTGVPQPIIGSVSGAFLNITGVQVANASANNVYLTFYGTGIGSVLSSIIGYTVAPANGGSNINYPVPLRTQVSQPFQASVSGVASVLISAQGFYSKV